MLVEMKDICKDYPQGRETVRVLKNVSLQVKEGDYLAIMGPSGSCLLYTSPSPRDS